MSGYMWSVCVRFTGFGALDLHAHAGVAGQPLAGRPGSLPVLLWSSPLPCPQSQHRPVPHAGGAGPPLASLPGSLPVLLEFLEKRRLLPRWVRRVLTQQPKWFEAAFNKAFSKVGSGVLRAACFDPGWRRVLCWKGGSG